MADEEFKKVLEASPEIELTVTGRTSGREISNPVWFVREGEKLYLVPVRGSDADWYKKCAEDADDPPRRRRSAAQREREPDLGRRQSRSGPRHVRAKYGAQDVEAYYSKQDVAVEVPLA
jgi:hypothetical protein